MIERLQGLSQYAVEGSRVSKCRASKVRYHNIVVQGQRVANCFGPLLRRGNLCAGHCALFSNEDQEFSDLHLSGRLELRGGQEIRRSKQEMVGRERQCGGAFRNLQGHDIDFFLVASVGNVVDGRKHECIPIERLD